MNHNERIKKLRNESLKGHDEFYKRMDEIRIEGELDRKRFPFNVIGIFITTFLTFGINDWIKTFHFEYWKENAWIPILSLIMLPVLLILTFKLPKIFIK